MHIYGGIQQGEVIADMVVVDLESGVIIHRDNYGLSNPELPLKHPGPKQGGIHAMIGSQMIIGGGSGSNGLCGNDAWTWDAESLLWADSRASREPIQRSEASMAVVDDTHFVIFGGATYFIEELLLNDLWEFSIDTGTWRQLFGGSSTIGPRPRAGAAVNVFSGKVYVVGGRVSIGLSDDALWMFSFETKQWEMHELRNTLSNHQRPLQRQGFGWFWVDSRLVIWGGQINSGTGIAEFYSSTAFLDVNSTFINSSSITGSIPERRKYHTMCALGGSKKTIMMHGGIEFGGSQLSDTWNYDIEDQVWTKKSYEDDGGFNGQGMSLCGRSGNSNIILKYDPSTEEEYAWMIQDDYNVRGRLRTINRNVPLLGLEYKAGVAISGILFTFGGRNKYYSSNKVFAYRPGFCVNDEFEAIHSHFKAAHFDDGSGAAMYLQDTMCKWKLANATSILVQKRMRQDDGLRILSLNGGALLHPTILTDGEGYETQFYEGLGFIVEMAAFGYENAQPEACKDCEGFLIIHAACGDAARFDVQLKECICLPGFVMSQGQDGCAPGPQQVQNQIMVVVGSSIGVFSFITIIFGVFYRRKMISTIKNVEAKLYGIIDRRDLIFDSIIGQGTFGEVFKGDYRGAEVAIKRLLEEDISSNALEEFKKEVSVIVQLRHPNIVLFMGASFQKGFLCLVSELMQQGTLYDVLHDSKKRLSLQTKLFFMIEIVKGMNYLHSSNPPILHRDLKSLNILVDDRFRLKVSDFGLSALQGAVIGEKKGMGSLMWLAPESYLYGIYESPADVYSFGIIVWEIMARKEPYQEYGIKSIPYLVSMENLRPVISEDVPEHVKHVMMNSWHSDPSMRPSFAGLQKNLSEYSQASVSAFSFVTDNSMGNEAPPAGDICIVFGSVQAAESLWEDIPSTMCEAAQMLSEFVRKLSIEDNGYISQCDGDSFLVVFQKVPEGIRFCVGLQEALQMANWSESILDHKTSSPTYEGNLKGLRVQMGLHFGNCYPNSRANSDRFQYAGKEIVATIKTCRLALGGQILCTKPAFELYTSAQDSVDSHVIVRKYSPSERSPEKEFYEVFGIRMQARADLMRECHNQALKSTSKCGSSSLNVPMTGSNLIETGNGDLINSRVNEKNGDQGRTDRAGIQELSPPRFSWWIENSELLETGPTLGVGSYGTVCVGDFKGEKVAIKKVSRLNERHGLYINFMTEVSMIRKIKHPNIITFIGAVNTPSYFGIVLELVEPGSLKEFLRSKAKAIDDIQKWRIINGIIDGMSYLHSFKPPLLHRDLKSANILVTKDFDIKICDFGFARMKSTSRTMTKCGTLAYEAPEVLLGRRYDEKIDVYSFAILLWEIEAREQPYKAEDATSLPFTVTKGKRPSVERLKDAKVVDMMQRCWVHDANERPSFNDLQRESVDSVEAIDFNVQECN
eukprot:TRINITY_DN9669_c0_g1_i2.p1 TRINITY_DN9669_c0_g1~~TRINITY_DN9669_c0_g1_i2.p1  ORF type:complete len:1419 (-),score=212.66 TRINITY_DN9669_c0_g1_i2:308-4564(-)